jgi:tetratricopeptide (TPR) repeat protein
MRHEGYRRTRTRLSVACFLGVLTAAALLLPSGCRRPAAQDPAALLKAGWDRYRLGEFDAAVSDFEHALRLAAAPQRQAVLYGLATTWNLRRPDQDAKRAAGYYRQVIELAPESDLAAWSLLALARLQHLVSVVEEPNYAAVREAYQAVVRQFPDHLAGHEAFVYLQATYVATLRPEDLRRAETNLLAFVEEHPSSGFLSAAYSLLCACYENLQRPDRWLWAEIKAFETAETDPTNPMQENSWSYWRIASVAEFEAGEFAVAREFYSRLISEYPEDIRVYAAKQALERMDAVEAGGKGSDQ